MTGLKEYGGIFGSKDWGGVVGRGLGILLCLWGLAGAPPASGDLIFNTNSTWKYFKGTSEASTPDTALWRSNNFNDSSWMTTNAPFYFGENLTGALLSDMRYNYTCIFMRKTFVLTNVAAIGSLTLGSICDDGYIAWINGWPVNRYNMPGGDIAYNGVSLPALAEPIPFETYTLNNPSQYLVNGSNVIAVQAFNCSRDSSSDFIMDLSLSSSVDATPPTMATRLPTPGTTNRELTAIEVHFSESVGGVEAADLLINGLPATNLVVYTPSQFVFEFAQPATGLVQVAWSAGHGIRDLASNSFAGGAWSYVLDTNLIVYSLVITEFMAANNNTTNDVDGNSSDWIEVYNASQNTLSLSGWFLTDSSADLAKWRFPSVALDANKYLLVFASGNNRTNPAAQLHTSFKLAASGGYLALVNPRTNVVSEFAPVYPPQQTDVSYGRDQQDLSLLGYFLTPTPGGPNTVSGPGFAPPIQYSSPGGTFINTFGLQLTTTNPNAVIRYTLDLSAVTTNSPVYTGPISITNTMQVRARAFQPGLLAGEPRTETYIKLDPTVLGFNSDLPVVIFHNFGAGGLPAETDQLACVTVLEPVNGRTYLTNAATLSSRAGINIRGRSTAGYPKSSLAVELWDEYNQDKEVEVLGMPAESDWAFYAPNNFEPILINNPVAHELSRQMGHYSPRTRFAEVYLNTAGGAIASGNYNGIYVIEEKIKRGPHRVDIDKLEPQHLASPEVTGGYLLKIDQADANERTFYAAGQGIVYVDPKGPDIQLPQRDAQEQYIINYFNSFYSALNSGSYTHPLTGYPAYVNVDSWIIHHIHNVVTFNVDALRLSGYFYKPRHGKICMGPVWDFDRTQGSTDGRDFNPTVWRSMVGDQGTDFFNYVWWGRMFTDPDFWQRWIDVYQHLRPTTLSTNNLNAIIDTFANQVRQAQPREQSRWGIAPRSGVNSGAGYTYNFGSGGYQAEVNWVKHWYAARVAFIDGQLLDPPALNQNGGVIAPGFTLTLTGPASPAGNKIYYTLDGSDPRQEGGAIAAAARLYTGPLTLTNITLITARCYNTNHTNLTGANNPPISSPWSGPTEARFSIHAPAAAGNVAITELNYDPAPPTAAELAITNCNNDDFEFLELRNISGAIVDLYSARFTKGISFSFATGSVVTLAPGAAVLLVKNPVAFNARYGARTNIAGVYDDQLNNAGEVLRLEDAAGRTILEFEYKDGWYPATDGLGFSLVLRNVNTPTNSYSDTLSWRASAGLGGSPGQDDAAPPVIPTIYINELLTHPALPMVDAVELYNPTAYPVNLAGWFLTDERSAPKKYRFVTNTLIAAGGYLVLTETNFNPTPGVAPSFSFSSQGEEVYLYSGDANTNLTGYGHGFSFGAAALGESFGRYTNSVGEEQFPAQAALTLGTNNAGPRIGPVVITEILYHPLMAADDEFVELENISAAPVPLFDPARPQNPWKLAGVAYEFPTNLTLAAGQRLVIVNGEPAAFRAKNNVPANALIVGPFGGTLQDSGENLELQRPDTPETGGSQTDVPYVVVDAVRYNDVAPWPVSADGQGPSLQKVSPTLYGNDPANWFASGITPGRSNAYNVSPTVMLLAPTNGATFTLPLTIALSASAADSDGQVLAVEFYADGVKLGEDTTAPYTLDWPNASPGTHTLYARVIDNGYATAASTQISLLVNPPPMGTGTGLRAEYYDNMDLTNLKVTRTDATVDFDWGNGSPDATVGADSFSARWTGRVQPRYSETYTFYTLSDDGVRLWVNGQALVSNWTDHAPTENSGSLTLIAGMYYDLTMEFFENGGGASARLYWSSPSVPKEIIPQIQLYPPGGNSFAPVVGALANQTVAENSLLSFTVTATDADVPAQSLTFTLETGAPTGASINANSGLFTWTPTEAQGPGLVTLTVRVTDNGSPALSSTKSFSVTVTEINTPPVLGNPGPLTVIEGALLTFTATASDADLPAQPLAFSLLPGAPAGASINPSNGVFTWTPSELDGGTTNGISLRVTDGALSATQTFNVTVLETNSRPVIPAIPNQVATISNLFSLLLTATDSDVPTHRLTFALNSGPAGATVSTNGLFAWNPTVAFVNTTNSVVFRVTDNGLPPLSATQTFSIIIPAIPNQAPVLAFISNKTVNEHSLLTFTATATDTNIQTLTFTLEPGAPAGAAITPGGVFSWTPNETQGGAAFPITVRVTDNGQPPLSDTKTFTATVLEVNDPPLLAPIGDKVVNEGSLLTFAVTATEPENQPMSFTLGSGAPAGASLTTNGVFTWTPTEAQGPSTNLVTIRVTDATSLTAAETIQMLVNEVNGPPVLAALSNRTVNVGQPLTFAASATDSDEPAQNLVFSLEPGAPPSATIQSSNGWFAWTPNLAYSGTTNRITVRVTDNGPGALSATQSFTVIVQPAANLSLTLSATPSLVTVSSNLVSTLTLANFGPAIATGIRLTNQLPEGLLLVSATASQSQCLATNGQVWYSLDSLASGAAVTLTIVAQALAPGTLTNWATASAREYDFEAANNTAVALVSALLPAWNLLNNQAITLQNANVTIPYPSVIQVTDKTGVVETVSVTVNNLNYSRPENLKLLLTGPNGQGVILMCAAGGSNQLNNVILTFTDQAATALPDNTLMTSGTYHPTDYGMGNVFPAPAPGGPYRTNLNAFRDGPLNGAWSLYAADATTGATGSIAGGWRLVLTAQNPVPAAASQWIGTTEEAPTIVNLGPVTNVAGTALTYLIVDSPQHGTLFGGNNARTYLPSPLYNGPDRFTFRVSDGSLTSAVATVTFNVGVVEDITPFLFGWPTYFGAGAQPAGVAAGDFNKDLKADLVVANAGAGTLTLLTGDGAGNFNWYNDLAVGGRPAALLLADVSKDNNPDLIVANGMAGTVNIWWGGGDGSFGLPLVLNLSGPAAGLALGDFNKDSRLDLAMAISGNGSASVALGNSMSYFSAPVDYPAGGNPVAIAVGDFNKDSRPDLATANAGDHTVSVLLGNGGGGFSNAAAYAVGSRPAALAAGDLNNDGRSDLAVANPDSGDISILCAGPNGVLSNAVPYFVGGQPAAVLAADFNKDGWVDLAVADLLENSVKVLLGHSGATFVHYYRDTGAYYGVGLAPVGLATNDFNKDGNVDLAVAHSGSDDVAVLLNNYTPRVYPQTLTGYEDQPLTVMLTGSAGPLTFRVTTNPTNGWLSGTIPNLVYAPNTNAYGKDRFDFVGDDSARTSAPARITLNILPVNDPPDFSLATNRVVVKEDFGAFKYLGFVTSVSKGPANEKSQTYKYQVSVDRPALFGTLPALSSAGQLSFTPAKNANGSAVVTAWVRDSGGTALGGQDTSPPRTFTVMVTNINDSPMLSRVSGLTILEDRSAAFNLTVADLETPSANLVLTVTSTNQALAPDSSIVVAVSNEWRRVVVTPLPDAFGKTLLTFTVSDGTNSASKTAVLTVTAVNDAPSFVLWTNRLAVPNQGITVTNQIILSASKGPANESAQILSYTIANPDPFFFALAPTLKPSGVLTFKPKTGVTGSVTLGITLKDTGGTLNGGVNTNGPVPLTIVITP